MAKPRSEKALDLWNESVARLSGAKFWTTGLLIVSSAAMGGIAVALWNRQSLARMRADGAEGGPELLSPSDKQSSFVDE